MTTVIELIEAGASQLAGAGLAFGHGTANAFDESAWLVLWRLGLPLDDLDAVADREVAPADVQRVVALLGERIATRKPAAYLTREAWLQDVPFYIDERAIVPRSFIAELLVDGDIDPWLGDHTRRVLDLCTGNGSLAVLAAMAYPDVSIDAADLSTTALEVAAINVTRHALDERITLVQSDGLARVHGPYDLILCNPPYVNARSMAALPAEYRAEPALALAGGPDGMDFIRRLFVEAPSVMNDDAVLVLEIGNERAHFEAAFPQLEVVWLATHAGEDQVLLVTRAELCSMITLKNVILRRSAKVLLDGASVTINPGEKVGLVGRNGAGKSTLFALFNGSLHEDGGDFFVPPQWRLAQVAQDMPETAEPATEFVVAGDTRLLELRAALAELDARHEADPDDADLGMALAHAYSDLADAGEHDAVPRAQALILGLGFKSHELDEPVDSFSGGWRMRLQLARALMCPSDLLLLDEPTNHLDLDALVWLEAWLQKYAGTMIVISHDREFLDAVTDVTLHIEKARLTRYGGNYSAFELLRAQQLELQQSAFVKQQDKIAHLQKFIDRFKAKASKAKQAQSRVKALERMEKVAPLLAEADFSFEFKEPGNIPNPMLSISGGSFGYQVPGEPPKTILRGVNRSVQAGQRIGILGANGQGKSTLVKTIAHEMGALAGTVTEGKGLNIGYFAQQELDVLRPQDTPLEHMVRMARELGSSVKERTGEQDLRGFLGSFNFSGDMVKQAVGTMSGGEKARLVLAMMVWQRPNLLLLDEPTNHLDLATREALAVALNEFEGTLMLVSHDRALLRSVCDEFWLVGRGAITDFDGDLDDYQRYLLDEAKRLREEAKLATREAAQAPAVTAPPVASSVADKQRRSEEAKPIKRELEDIDGRLAALSAEKAALEARLANPLPAAEIADAGKRLKTVNDEIARLEERWLALSDQLEGLAA